MITPVTKTIDPYIAARSLASFFNGTIIEDIQGELIDKRREKLQQTLARLKSKNVTF
jgi:hypothetical protein